MIVDEVKSFWASSTPYNIASLVLFNARPAIKVAKD